MCRKNKLIMRVVLSELMTHHPNPIFPNEIGNSGMQTEDLDNAIACLASENFISYNEDGSLVLSSSFDPMR